jgi:hypothetical protein
MEREKKPNKQTPTCCRKNCSRKHHLQPRNTKTELRASSPALTIRYLEKASTKASELPKELLLLLTTTSEEISVPPHKDVRAHTRTTRNAPQTKEEKQAHLLEEPYKCCCVVMRI